MADFDGLNLLDESRPGAPRETQASAMRILRVPDQNPIRQSHLKAVPPLAR